MTNVITQIRPPYPQPAFRGASPQPQISGIVINSEISKVLQELDPNYITHIKKAIDSSVSGILKPVIERSVTIALITTREIVLKDFALDPNGNKLLEAANQMVQCLAGSLAMVTCREPLRMSMTNQLKETLKRYDLPQKELEQIVKAISNENLDIGSTYIQKSVINKAKQRVSEDAAIREALEMRTPKNQVVLTYNTPKQLPEALRPKKEGLSAAELEVYNELSRVLKENTTSLIGDLIMQGEIEPKGKYKITDSLQTLHSIVEGEDYTHPETIAGAMTRIKQDMQEIERVPKMLDQISREAFQYFVKLMTSEEKASKEKARIYLQLLLILGEYYKHLSSLIADQLTKNYPDNIKYNYELVAALFQNSLINIGIYDKELSLALRNITPMSPTSADDLITFVSMLVLNLVLSEKILLPAQLTCTFMELNSIQRYPKVKENVAFASMLTSLSSNDKNPKAVASQLFEEWVTLNQDQSQEQLQSYFVKLTLHLSSDDRFLTFFAVALDAAIQQALFSPLSTPANENVMVENYPDRLNFRLIDSILKLLFTLLPYKLQMCTKYFSNFMHALANSIKAEHTNRPLQFNQRPYYRFFIIILQSLKKPEFKMLPHSEMLQYITLTLHEVSPKHCSGFTFAWLDLVSHRNFMPDLLQLKNEEKLYSNKFMILLCDMYEFLRYLALSNDQFNSTQLTLYLEAVVRITLILAHDFPDFLVQNYLDLLPRLPERCVQLRNIILSAAPSNINLPNPKSGIHFDRLPEQRTPPSIAFDYKQILAYRGIKEDIDKYIITATPSLLVDVCNKLMSPDSNNRMKRPGVEVFHSIVLYLAEIGIAYDPPKKELSITSILLNIISKLDLQAREQLINEMFNEIRYPNSYTHYFIMFLLHLMESGSSVLIQEQVLRILLERVTAHPPTPWGITIFFLELTQNPKYDLVNKPFVKGYKEIETMITTRLNVD